MAFLLIAISCSFLQYMLMTLASSQAIADHPNSVVSMASAFDEASRNYFLASLCALIPLTISIGILLTFRVWGPIYALQKHLELIQEGGDPGELSFRQSDEFQQIPPLVNGAVNGLKKESMEAYSECTEELEKA